EPHDLDRDRAKLVFGWRESSGRVAAGMAQQFFERADVPRFPVTQRPLPGTLVRICGRSRLQSPIVCDRSTERFTRRFDLHLNAGDVDRTRAHIAEEAARSQPCAWA